MRKFTLFLSLFFAMAMTALAQSYSVTETRLNSEELNAKTAPTLIAIKNLSKTNNYYFVGNTGAAPYSKADFSDASVFVWQPVEEGVAGSYYLMKLDGTYMQASSPKDFGTVDNAAVFTTANPTTEGGSGAPFFNGDGDSQEYIDDQALLVRFVKGTNWINVQNGDTGTPTYNSGTGGWTIHYVYAVEAPVPAVKYYRVKELNTGLYLNAANHDEHASGAYGGVNLSALADSDDQIFTLESAGENNAYYLKTASGYYIYCQAWNVDALDKKSVLNFVDAGESLFYIMNGSKYFKVENVGGTYYPFCDAPENLKATWILEEIIESEEYEIDNYNKFVNGDVYTFVTERGWMGATAESTNVISTAKTKVDADKDNAMFRWVVYKSVNKKYYLYNVGKGMFMGVQTANNTSVPFSATPAGVNLTFKSSSSAEYPIMFSTDNSGVVNHSSAHGEGLINWTGGWGNLNDGGSNHKVTRVGVIDEATLVSIQEAVEAYENAPVEAEPLVTTHYYLLKNKHHKTSLTNINGSVGVTVSGNVSESDNNQLWALVEGETEGTYKLQNRATGKYVTHTTNLNTCWTLTDNASEFYIGVQTSATTLSSPYYYVSFEKIEDINNASRTTMHDANWGADNSYKQVVTWDNTSDPSQWEMVRTNIEVLTNDAAKNVLASLVATAESLFAYVGEGVGKYSSSDADYQTKIQTILSFYNSIDTSTSVSDIEAKIAELEALMASFSLNMPEKGNYYRLKGVSGNYIDASSIYNNATATEGQMSMKSAEDCNLAGTIFYLDKESHLLNYATGTYTKDTREIAPMDYAKISVWNITASTNSGSYGKYFFTDTNTSASANLHDNAGNRADRCSSVCGVRHDFAIESVAALPVAVTAAGYATFYAPVAVTIPDGIEAFYATQVKGEYISLIKIENTIPANTGVVLKGAEGTYSFEITTTEATIENNLFNGTPNKTVITKAEGSYYIMAVVDGEVGMYSPVKGEDDATFINAGHKAYMYINAPANSAGYHFDFDGTTGISVVEAESDAVIYDLTGRRVNDMSRSGIYIVNGRKVLVK